MHLLEKAPRTHVKPTPDHNFSQEELSPALRRRFAIAENHAALMGNLAAETTTLNTSINTVVEDSPHNTRLLTAQVKDEISQGLRQVAAETAAKAPQTAAGFLGANTYQLRTELSSYDNGINARMSELDASCRPSLAALELVAEDTSSEFENVGSTSAESSEGRRQVCRCCSTGSKP